MLYRLINFYKNNILFAVLVTAIFLLALFIRLHNLSLYSTYWADDGGAHLQYIDIILSENRLPASSETYLAWHEPVFYTGMALWVKVGGFVGVKVSNIDWQEIPNLIFGITFVGLAAWLAYVYSKSRWVAFSSIFLFSVLFTGVKLSAYVNNEMLVQTFIILLSILFVQLKLFDFGKNKKVVQWSVLLAFVMLVKLTAVIVLFAVIIVWLLHWVKNKKKHVLKYICLSLFVVSILNAPWLAYKHFTFGSALSINLYEEEKQSLIHSEAWDYILAVNPRIFTDEPYWQSNPPSFISILLADTFSDYYNLFNQVDLINALEDKQKIFTDNGRFTTPEFFKSAVLMNRLGFFISLVWLIGLLGVVLSRVKSKKIDWYEVFFVILIFGGLSALIYNNLRHPYLERGVLKASFIYFVYPLVAAISYTWWWQKVKPVFFSILVVIPIVIYTVVGWSVLII